MNSVSYETPEKTTGNYSHIGVYKVTIAGMNLDGFMETQTTRCIPMMHQLLNWHLSQRAEPHSGVREYHRKKVRKRWGKTIWLWLYLSNRDGCSSNGCVCKGPIGLNVSCYGVHNCGCAETIVPLTDPTGQRMCPRSQGNSSRVNADGCVTDPIITPATYAAYYTKTDGRGTIVIIDGASATTFVQCINRVC